jgi:hypothetical protein
MSSVTGKMRDLLTSRIRLVMITVGFLAALLVVASRAIDEGEIVKLTTVDASGRSHVTEVWIVDLDDGPYLRAGSPDVEWLSRVRDRTEITVQRGDRDAKFRAVLLERAPTREQVNVAMRDKYGFADRLWGRIADQGRSVPIRLVPAGAAMTASP